MKIALPQFLIPVCLLACFLTPVFAATTTVSPVQARAIFFFKPDCPVCEQLRRSTLPEIKARFGDQLEILALNTSNPESGTIYLHTLLSLGIPASAPLPLVVSGNQYWSGVDISRGFPGAVESAISGGGNQWPSLQGLPALLKAINDLDLSDRRRWFVSDKPDTASLFMENILRKFRKDITGNSYAVTLLIGMIVSLFYAIYRLLHRNRNASLKAGTFQRWLIMVFLILGIAVAWQLAEIDRIMQGNKALTSLLSQPLSVIILVAVIVGFVASFQVLFSGSREKFEIWQRWFPLLMLGVGTIAAGYLAWVEAMQTEAVCGAVGDCNAVQQSEYANLLGIVSVAALGIFGNVMILLGWLCENYGPEKYRDSARLATWGILLMGVLFFIYLTFLEPFVIGATCFWCLTAASAMTVQLLVVITPVSQTVQRLPGMNINEPENP